MNILIVDDEKLIRNWLEMFLRQVVGSDNLQVYSCASAERAIEICEEIHPIDLLITDIRMTKMSGIDLIIHLEKTHPEIHVAVLSTYDDFEYVRTAMKHGAIDYILKSEMQIADIESLIQKVTLLSRPVSPYYGLDDTPVKDMNLLFRDYLEETITIHNLLSIFSCIQDERFGVIIFDLDGKDGAFEKDIINTCKMTLEGEKLSGYLFNNENRCVLLYHSEQIISEERDTQIQKLLLLLERNLRDRISCEIHDIHGRSFSSVSDLDIYLHVQFRYVFASHYYGGIPLHEEDLLHINGDTIREISDTIYFDINHHRYSDALIVIEEFVQKSHKEHIYPSEIKGVVIHWLTILFSSHNSDDQVSDIITGYQSILKQLYGSHTKEDLWATLEKFHYSYLALIDKEHSSIMHPTIKEALAYIDSHYTEQFSLDDLAVQLAMNKSYLSHLFAKETGINITDYLEKVRIYKAQSLLRETSSSIAHIAEMVGYTSQSYFSKAFKKSTGITPNTYRASFRN